jgi:hypothetical protein
LRASLIRVRLRLPLLLEISFVPRKPTTAHRSPWTKEDVQTLKAHSKARAIAKVMKRTESALRRKAGILGIGLGHNR